jgi:hypothetical protein
VHSHLEVHVHGQLSLHAWSAESTCMVTEFLVHDQLKVHVHGHWSPRAWSAESPRVTHG